jgi:hypothetical protein
MNFKNLTNPKNWLTSVILFAFQFIFVVLLAGPLARTVGVVAFLIPALVLIVLVGMVYRQKWFFLTGFVWTIIMLTHGVALMLIEFNLLQLIYVGWAFFQGLFISQTKLD